MDKIVLDQLSDKVHIPSRQKQLYSPIRINPDNQLLFLRIFKEVRKSLKKGSQFDVAIKIKSIFKVAKVKGTFEYISESEYKYNFDTNRNEYIPLTAEELELKRSLQLKLRESFLREIGLTLKSFNYLYGYFNLDDLEAYYAYATPAAIVQMKKRLAKTKG